MMLVSEDRIYVQYRNRILLGINCYMYAMFLLLTCINVQTVVT